MKARWAVALVFLIAGSAVSAFAGPTIGVLDPTCNKNTTGVIKVDDTFVHADNTVSLPSITSVNGGGTFTFCNLTQLYWTQVNFSVNNFLGLTPQTWNLGDPTPSDPNMIQCSVGSGDTQSFLHCSVVVTQNSISMDFFGTDGAPGQGNDILGVRNNHTMTVTLNNGYCITGVSECTDNGGWKDGSGNPITVAGAANGIPAPEPASLVLLGAGLASMLLRQRKRS
jgi:hypothetical protein